MLHLHDVTFLFARHSLTWLLARRFPLINHRTIASMNVLTRGRLRPLKTCDAYVWTPGHCIGLQRASSNRAFWSPKQRIASMIFWFWQHILRCFLTDGQSMPIKASMLHTPIACSVRVSLYTSTSQRRQITSLIAIYILYQHALHVNDRFPPCRYPCCCSRHRVKVGSLSLFALPMEQLDLDAECLPT